MKTLITGHKGFIGSNLYKRIGGDGIDLKDGNDIRTYDFKEKYDVIFHMAAQASIPFSIEHPEESYDHNVNGTKRILEYALRTGAKVVFSSSSSVYEMMSPYALQKGLCEAWMKFYWAQGLKCVALRYFNVFGEGQEIANGGDGLALAIFLKQYREGNPFTVVGTGEQRRDFVYVGDICNANILAAKWLDTATEFKTFDIGTGMNYSINEVLDLIDKEHPRVYLPPRKEPFENRASFLSAYKELGFEFKTDLHTWLRQL